MSITSLTHSMVRKSVAAALLLVLCMMVRTANAQAQGTVTPSPRCDRIDSTAAWYKSQAEWWHLDAAHDWTNDSLRKVLLSAAATLEPMVGAFPIQFGFMIAPAAKGSPVAVSPIVAQVRDSLRAMAKRRTWPSRSLVGAAGVHATWLLIRDDSALATLGNHQMMESGLGEAAPADVAVLEDWLRVQTGRKQLYSSQLVEVRDAKGQVHLQPGPTEDLAHVDLRRDAAGLPPLAFALCRAARKGGS